MGDLAVDGYPVHMHVEHVHEHCNADERCIAHVQLVRGHRRLDHLHHAVSGADDKIASSRRDTVGIAEEIDAPCGQDEAWNEQGCPQPPKKQCDDKKDRDKPPAFAVDRDHDTFQQIVQTCLVLPP